MSSLTVEPRIIWLDEMRYSQIYIAYCIDDFHISSNFSLAGIELWASSLREIVKMNIFIEIFGRPKEPLFYSILASIKCKYFLLYFT